MCGIFGVIHNRKSKLNKAVFSALGVVNDTRGGDSCGIALDDNTDYGVDKNKLFKDFFLQSKVLKEETHCNFAFGHCRKASVGGISLKAAQPVVIEVDGIKEYILIHNGTISNYKELSKKYIPEQDIKDLTDSQVMALIFYYKGYDVLKEYIGAGVFIMADFREDRDNPIIRMFKGESRYTNNSKEPSEERPLFITKETDCIWFSSIYPILSALRYGSEVYTATPNVLYTIKGATIVDRTYYSRDKVYQTEPITFENYAFNSYCVPNFRSKNILLKNWIEAPYEIKGKIQYFPNGLFYVNKELADGILEANHYGTLNINSKFTDNFPMFNGVLLYNEEVYNYLDRVCKKLELTHNELATLAPDIVWKFSYLPKVDIKNKEPYFSEVFSGYPISYTGELPTLFAVYPRIYNIKKGVIKSYVEVPFNDSGTLLDTYLKTKSSFVWDFNKEYNKAITKLNTIIL